MYVVQALIGALLLSIGVGYMSYTEPLPIYLGALFLAMIGFCVLGDAVVCVGLRRVERRIALAQQRIAP